MKNAKIILSWLLALLLVLNPLFGGLADLSGASAEGEETEFQQNNDAEESDGEESEGEESNGEESEGEESDGEESNSEESDGEESNGEESEGEESESEEFEGEESDGEESESEESEGDESDGEESDEDEDEGEEEELVSAAGVTTTVSTKSEFDTAANNGGSIILGADITLNLAWGKDFNKDLTIDLNGKTITVVATGEGYTDFKLHQALTIRDSGSGGKISIPITRSGQECGISLFYDTATLTLESGTLEFTGVYNGVYNKGINLATGTFTMTGGTITSSGTAINRNGGSAVISGGTLNAGFTDSNGSMTITGGSFCFDPSAYLSSGYATTKTGDYWVVEALPPVADVNGTTYTSFAAALSAWTDGTTLTLLTDVKTTGSISVSGTKTLDLNGYGINANGGAFPAIAVVNGANLTLNDSEPSRTDTGDNRPSGVAGGYITGVNISENVECGGMDIHGTVTMNGGTITGCQGSRGGGVKLEGDGTFTMNGGMIIGNTSYHGGGIHTFGNFIMNGGLIANNTASNKGGGVMVSVNFTMNGGTITDNTASNGNNVKSDNGAYVAVSFNANGGTGTMSDQYVKENTATTIKANVNYDTNGAKSDPALSRDGYTFAGWNTAADGSGTTYVAGTDSISVSADTTLYALWLKIVADVNGTEYTSFSTALSAWTDGTTLKLLDDVTTASTITVSGTNTLDLNGNTLTLNANNNDSGLRVKGSGKLTIQDSGTSGRITRNGVFAGPLFAVEFGSNLQMNGGTITGVEANGGDIALFYCGGTVNIADGATLTNNNCYVAYIDGAFNVTGGEISHNTTTCGSRPAALYVANNGTVTISGSPTITDNSPADLLYTNGNDLWKLQSGDSIKLYCDVTVRSTISVTGTKTLDLSGHGIRMTGSGRVFEVPSGANLTINDSGTARDHYITLSNYRGTAVSDTGTEFDVTDGSGVVKVSGGYITGGYITSYNGSALDVYGTLNLVKGTVIGNKSTGTGGAIAVESSNSIFNMSGGEICYNDAQSAGGVRVLHGHMDMSGGTIHHNYAYNTLANDPGKGGGIQLDGSDCSFTMTGGSIEYNTAYYHAGGLALYGSATISGGSIVNNQAGDRACNYGWNGGGVYVHTSASLTVSGNTVITGNKKGETTNNVYLAEDRKITVGGELTGAIGVTMATPGVFTSSTDTSLNDASKFTSDNTSYAVGKNADGQLLLGAPVTVTYATDHGTAPDAQTVASGGVIALAAALTASGWTFDGWSDGTNTYDAEAEVTVSAASTFTARWTVIPATAPTVSAQPQALSLTYGYESGGLSVTAEAAEGHSVTGYQWYVNTANSTENAAAIDGATDASYTLPTGKNVGTEYYFCVVTATRTDNGETASTTSAVAALTVGRAAATVNADFIHKAYGDADPTLTATVTGLKNGDAASVIRYTLERARGEEIGLYTIFSSGEAVQGNYNVSYELGALTIDRAAVTVTANSKSKTYGDDDPTFTASVTGLKNGDAASVIRYTLSRAGGENAGDYTITPSGEAVQGNYTVRFVSGRLTVNKATPEYEIPTGLTATYGDTLSDVSMPAGWSWIASGEREVGSAGTHSFTATFTPADTRNYRNVNRILKLTVEKAVPDEGERPEEVETFEFDGEAHVLAAEGSTEDGVYCYRLGEDGDWSETPPEAEKADTYTVYFYLKGDENHLDLGSEDAPLGSFELTVSPRMTTQVEGGSDESAVAVEGLDEVADALQKEMGASDVSVQMSVARRTEAEGGEDAAAIRTQLAENQDMDVFEIDIEAMVDSVSTLVTETGTVLKIVVPYSFTGKENPAVYHCHDGVVTTLTESDSEEDGTCQLDIEGGTVTIYSSRFSAYAVGYTQLYTFTGSIHYGDYTGPVTVSLLNSDGVEAAQAAVDLSGGLGVYQFIHIPKGTYLLSAAWTENDEPLSLEETIEVK